MKQSEDSGRRVNTGERVVATACLAVAGMCMSFFLEPLLPLGSWIWLFLTLTLISGAFYRQWWPSFIGWTWKARVLVFVALIGVSWIASRAFPGVRVPSHPTLALNGEVREPERSDLSETNEASRSANDDSGGVVPRSGRHVRGIEENPLNLDSNEAHIKSGRQVRAPADESKDYEVATVAEIVGPLWGLTNIQRESATAHYLGRRYMVSGRIRNISRTSNYERIGYVMLDAPLSEPQVSAYLREDELENVARWNVGDTITLSGRIYQVDRMEIFLDDTVAIGEP